MPPITSGQTRSIADDVRQLFEKCGGSQYGGEAVTQLAHALQAASMAEQDRADAALIVAALLHDVGHLLHELPDDSPDHGIDDLHERLGAEWLASRFPAEVTAPVRLHVESKRYLCAADEGYWDRLSEPSRQSLALQGGPMSEAECDSFRRGAHFERAIALRRWDDAAKIAGLQTPSLEHFLGYVDRVAGQAAT